jgi:hypothetical protein
MVGDGTTWVVEHFVRLYAYLKILMLERSLLCCCATKSIQTRVSSHHTFFVFSLLILKPVPPMKPCEFELKLKKQVIRGRVASLRWLASWLGS